MIEREMMFNDTGFEYVYHVERMELWNENEMKEWNEMNGVLGHNSAL